MSGVHFQAGGPLPACSSVYISRRADVWAAAHLRRMEYITLVEPREHGKTSLINRLIGQFSPQGYTFAYRDLMAAQSSAGSPADWYASLGKWLLRQLRFIPRDQRPESLTDSASWEDFLADVAEHAAAAGQNVVIALDEIGAMPSDWATDFFSVVRSVYTSRQSLPFWQHLTFIIAGAFNPKELIQDETVSNFNVDQRISLDDFDLSQVRQLVAHLGLPDGLSEAVAGRIHYWTDGQPYLCQRLCLHLAECQDPITVPSVDAMVDHAVECFFRDDTHHLVRIHDLAADPDLLTYALRITTEPRSRFSAALNDRHFRLAHIIGVVKADPDGRCQVRNRVYERALAEIEVAPDANPDEEIQPQPQDEFQYDAFVSYSHADGDWVRDTLLPCLESEGLRICIDYRDFELGAPSLVNMENAVDRSRKTLLVLTPNWVDSEWTEFEALLIQTRDPAGRGRRILPLMVQPCDLPSRLQVFTYLDLADPAQFDFQMRRLVAAIRAAPQPPAPAQAAPAPRPAPPARPRARGFSHERGLAALGDLLAHADVQIRLDFAVLQSRLLDNLQHERLYGSSETIRSERARVLHELNRLALAHLGHSFNDLCRVLEETHAVIRPEPESAQPLPASQPVSSKAADLRLLVADPSGEQSASRLEFSIPPANSSRRPAPAWQVAFRLYLDNQRPTMARYVIVELCMTSNTDSFWLYRYEDAPFLIEEGPRPWQITPSDTHIHCYLEGGADFVCHDEVRQNLGLVKMLVPYSQADTILTFQYRLLAEGWKSQGSFAIALKPGR